MYVIQFKLFAGRLEVDTIGGDYVPKGSPILIIFTLSKEHTKFSILKEFRKHLEIKGIEWIKPHENLTEEWIIDLETLRTSFNFLKREDLYEKILLEPIFEKKEGIDYITEKPLIKETSLKFKINPNELVIFKQNKQEDYLSDLRDPLTKFYKDHRQNNKCAFLMMICLLIFELICTAVGLESQFLIE